MNQDLPVEAKKPFTVSLNSVNPSGARIIYSEASTAITKDLKKHIEGLQLLLGTSGTHAMLTIDFSLKNVPFISEITIAKFNPEHPNYKGSAQAFEKLNGMLGKHTPNLMKFGGMESARDAHKGNWVFDTEQVQIITSKLPTVAEKVAGRA